MRKRKQRVSVANDSAASTEQRIREVNQSVDEAMSIYVGNAFAHEVVLLELLTRLRDILGKDDIAQVLAASERSMVSAGMQAAGTSDQIASALHTLNLLGKCLGYGDLFGHPAGQSPTVV